MTHLVWFGLWRALMNAAHITAGPAYGVATVVLLVGALGVAWLMWRLVEEPAREWMRSVSGARMKPTEEVGESEALAIANDDPAGPVRIPG
jgi:peptidoglycan/LPS O-acetylase OafA/YrhL